MNVLIVHAHENPDSFCSSLCQQTKDKFGSKGHKVELSDLYAIGFNPIAGKDDFKHDTSEGYYKYAFQQLAAVNGNTFSDDIRSEMDKMLAADVLNFNFPLWWFGMPAILKGWIDRVLAYCFAYGGDHGMGKDGRFKGRKAFVTVTTGSPADAYQVGGRNKRTINNILANIHEGVFELVGYEVMEPFVGYGVSRIGEDERKLIKSEYDEYLSKLI